MDKTASNIVDYFNKSIEDRVKSFDNMSDTEQERIEIIEDLDSLNIEKKSKLACVCHALTGGKLSSRLPYGDKKYDNFFTKEDLKKIEKTFSNVDKDKAHEIYLAKYKAAQR